MFLTNNRFIFKYILNIPILYKVGFILVNTICNIEIFIYLSWMVLNGRLLRSSKNCVLALFIGTKFFIITPSRLITSSISGWA